MAQMKNKTKWIVLGIAIIALIIFSQASTEKEPLNKPGDLLNINLYDAEGNLIEQSVAGRQSTVGGIQGVAFINFDTVITNTGEINLKDMRISNSEPYALRQAYGDAITIATLTPGTTHTWSSELIDVQQFEGQTVSFEVYVDGNYVDGSGETRTIQKTGIKEVTIQPDVCSDGTPWDSCSGTQPKFCEEGVLVDKATVCGCAEGYEQSTTNPDVCVVPTCVDGTETNTCTSTQPEYCDGNKNIINNCAACGCPDDYYGNPQVCQVDGSCEPQGYEVDFTISLGYD